MLNQRIVDDLVLECAEIAACLTCCDSEMVIGNLTNALVSKCRIHDCVQQVGEFMTKERRRLPSSNVDLIEADGTKCRSLGGDKNEVNVVLGKNQENGEKRLLGLSVNEDW